MTHIFGRFHRKRLQSYFLVVFVHFIESGQCLNDTESAYIHACMSIILDPTTQFNKGTDSMGKLTDDIIKMRNIASLIQEHIIEHNMKCLQCLQYLIPTTIDFSTFSCSDR